MRSVLKINLLTLILLLFSFLSFFACPVAGTFPNGVSPTKDDFTEPENATPSTTDNNLIARTTWPDEAECSSAITNPPRDKSLFYSKAPRGSVFPKLLRQRYMTVNRVYPDHFWENSGDRHDPDYISFIDRTSRIFAERSSGTVSVIIGEERPCSTWVRVELPALKENDQVEEIVSVGPFDENSKSTIWKKGDPVKRQGLPPWDGGECLDFDDISELDQ